MIGRIRSGWSVYVATDRNEWTLINGIGGIGHNRLDGDGHGWRGNRESGK
jgi:hypothetical protein